MNLPPLLISLLLIHLSPLLLQILLLLLLIRLYPILLQILLLLLLIRLSLLLLLILISLLFKQLSPFLGRYAGIYTVHVFRCFLVKLSVGVVGLFF